MVKSSPLLQLKAITKRFPGVIALDNADFELGHGEVRALVGENGAGKSTLIKILSGRYRRDSGDILVEGRTVEIRGPTDALNLGLGFIHQELNVVPERTVAENIFLGRLPVRGPLRFLERRTLYREAEQVLQSLHIDLDPTSSMHSLSIGHRKIVEVAKAVSRQINVLVMDEPTAALAAREIELLFNLIHSLKERGISVIYVSHQLDEIFRIADCVSILRNGKSVGVEEAGEEKRAKIISLMVGRTLEEMYPKSDIVLGDEILRVEGITKKGLFSDISFALRKGEILGIYGVIGSGQDGIMRALCGDLIPDSGNIMLRGVSTHISSPSSARNMGVGILPGDRKSAGLVLGHPVFANASLGSLSNFTEWGILRPALQKKRASYWMDSLRIKARGPEQVIDDLSGGNQQKVILARLLEAKVDVLLLEEPTAGVDVGARVEIYRILESLCSAGKSTILVSSDLQEVLAMTDRILLLKNGRIVGELETKKATKELVLQYTL